MSVSLRSVHVAFGGRTVLRDLNLDVRPGDLIALMGPSGSGKTTALSVLAGLREPDAGSRTVASEGLAIAWVFQTSPVLMRRTASENVALGPLCAGIGDEVAQARAVEAMAQLGIDELGAERLHRLSGGERQRVVIARALASGADLVIADEPTAALDARAKDLVVDALVRVARAGSAVVVATHDRAVADRCDRVALVSHGRLEASDERADTSRVR